MTNPLADYRMTGLDSTKQPLDADHPLARLLARPATQLTPEFFLERTAHYLLKDQKVYWVRIKNSFGFPDLFCAVAPANVSPIPESAFMMVALGPTNQLSFPGEDVGCVLWDLQYPQHEMPKLVGIALTSFIAHCFNPDYRIELRKAPAENPFFAKARNW